LNLQQRSMKMTFEEMTRKMNEVGPCTGCGKCHKDGTCPLDEKRMKIFEEYKKSNNL